MVYSVIARKVKKKVSNKFNDIKYNIGPSIVGKKQEYSIRNKKANSFSIITSAYNTGEYLDDYFKSILNNNYDLSLIEIILVDDGSCDNTKEIVEKYSVKYPNVIKYYYQENQGQSIARNEGIKLATNDWITFIDSDDYVSKNYFNEINNGINYSDGQSCVIANIYNYMEGMNKIKNNHPLRYRYQYRGKYRKSSLLKSEHDYFLHITTSFIKREELIKSNVLFEDIKPYFEDGKFILEYLLQTNNFNVCYVKDAIYYYRKRSSANSTIDKSKNDTRRYVDLLNKGYLSMLRKYHDKFNEIPLFLQNEIYYDLKWNIEGYDTSKLKLTQEQLELRKQYLKEIFSYIDFDTITKEKNLNYIKDYYQIGFNKMYYNNAFSKKSSATYYYETNDWISYQLFSCDLNWSIELDNKVFEIKDFENRIFEREHCNSEFVKEILIKIPKPFNNITFKYQDQKQEVKGFVNNFKEKRFNPNSRIIFFDRDVKADDNAEVFYDWMRKNHPEYKNIMFAIDKKCDDYQRLKAKGYNLIDYSSLRFDVEYIKADYILSSALDHFIVNYRQYRFDEFRSRSRFIFLQHGVVAQNISGFLCSKKYDKIVASAHNEANEFRHEPYNFFDDQVIECGLPRHDLLINDPKDVILFQPTWRHNLKDLDDDAFSKSDYAMQIVGFLTDEKLYKLLEKHKFQLHFLLHPSPGMIRFYDYFKQFENEYIKVLNPLNEIYREKLCQGKIQITDYSSVRFDFAFMKKPVLLIHTDHESFSANHICEARNDYDTSDVGKVVESYSDLVNELEILLDNDCQMEEKYLNRINNLFINMDRKNCERLFDALTKY